MTKNRHSVPLPPPERSDLDLDPYHFTWDRKRPMRLFSEFTGSRALFWAMLATGVALMIAGLSAWAYNSLAAGIVAAALAVLLVVEIVLILVYTPDQRPDPPRRKRRKRRR